MGRAFLLLPMAHENTIGPCMGTGADLAIWGPKANIARGAFKSLLLTRNREWGSWSGAPCNFGKLDEPKAVARLCLYCQTAPVWELTDYTQAGRQAMAHIRWHQQLQIQPLSLPFLGLDFDGWAPHCGLTHGLGCIPTPNHII